MGEKRKPTIRELEELLDRDEETSVEILPNGEIRERGSTEPVDMAGKKPLTYREQLGGEYAALPI